MGPRSLDEAAVIVSLGKSSHGPELRRKQVDCFFHHFLGNQITVYVRVVICGDLSVSASLCLSVSISLSVSAAGLVYCWLLVFARLRP